MKTPLALLVALALCQTSASGQVMIAPQGDVTFLPGPTLDLGGHLTLETPFYFGFDGAIATSVFGGTFDYADGDLSIHAIPFIKGVTLAPRLGLSSVIAGDEHAFTGVNYGLAVRRRTPSGDLIRVDVIYRQVAGHPLYTLAIGQEFKI